MFVPDRALSKTQARAAFGLPPEAPLIVSTGRLNALKDHVALVDALRGVAGAHLAIAGDGPKRQAILDRAALMLRTGGVLAYATCSLLERENGDQIRAFLARHPGWTLGSELRLTPLQGGDGFYLAILRRV